MGRMAGIHAERLIRALERLGWRVIRSKGSHHAVARNGRPGVVIVPMHKGTLAEGTARAILKQAALSEDEFFAVYR
jgi:predicted RNA binding protein YcfA (HicA-like mRNA interferase family)